MKIRNAAVLALVLLASCATSVQSDLYDLRAAINTAETGADTYVNLPLCGTEATGQLCSTKATITAMVKAKATAETAYTTAKASASQDAISQAQAAFAAFQALVSAPATTTTGQ